MTTNLLTLLAGLLILSCPATVSGVVGPADSDARPDIFQNHFETHKNDSLEIGMFMNTGKSYFPRDVKLAHLYTDSALLVATTLNRWRQAGLAEQRHGMYYKSTGDFNLAERHFLKAKEIFDKYQYASEGAWVSKRLGDLNMDQGNYVQSMSFYINGIQLAEEADDQRAMAFCYRGIAFLYYQHHEPEKSVENIQKAYQIFLSTDYDTLDLADMLQTLAVGLAENGRTDSAIACYETAVYYNKIYDNKSGLAGNLNNLGLIYENREAYDRALSCYSQCLEIDSELGDSFGLTFSHIGLANVYFKLGQTDSALFHAKKSFEIASALNALQRMQKVGESLIQIYKTLRKYDSALRYYEITTMVKDSLYQRAKVRESYELQTKYETEKREILLLTKQKQLAEFRQKTYIFSGIALSLFLLLIYNRQRVKSRKNRLLLEKEKDLDADVKRHHCRRMERAGIRRHL